jgi:hypothetical protein
MAFSLFIHCLWRIGVLPGESACKDVLTVTENSRLLLYKCGDIEEPITVDSFENELNISLSVKSTFQAKRGLLAYLSGTFSFSPEIVEILVLIVVPVIRDQLVKKFPLRW